MAHSADQLVTEFCARWADPDPAQLAEYFTEDGIYHNMPMPPSQGRAAIREFIAGFTAMCDGIDFVGWISAKELDEIIGLTVGQLVEFIASCPR